LVGGLSGQGRRAAASHTGGMVSDTRIWSALAAQIGISIVATQDDLIGVLDFFDLHAARDVAGAADTLVIGPSGGASVLAADAFDAAGRTLGDLPDDARESLRGLGLGLGTGSSLANLLEVPVGPRGDPDLIRHAVTAITAHRPYADVIAHVNVQSFVTYGTSADPLLAYARSIGTLQNELPATRVTMVIRNGECAPAGVEDAVRASGVGRRASGVGRRASRCTGAWRRRRRRRSRRATPNLTTRRRRGQA
jgi:hypothetical protein